ncbi:MULTISPECIES: N-acetylmuramoyl-L-alanine amidase family protein [Psychrilyobacter]|uniref:N-acetylmuramoyl-L-alanine amidase n=1 Tax=Psychrilyobacter piezotolerans TaxID=2293438 RepID=A0ABX9KL70_9FUSO|nr:MULTISPECIES: N-acetylmuramoyl-L-alanine amidase [Psychrilyobacter]MCS5421492.1 N-acetylmuramoyl-L-alanine amidase [Psychrilyobacter sp. S5]NDI76532.1 N-acetylmuramoyl-L-alanine amidase [Psychrilyobacter piezotolerans]RDE66123.1 N-acetylmuramoyl-L-alanine amidase [Psychrilyobacter sp. S5]REI43301.1 N-acetylmuramoyl-L-alanine amidase [Psychrilyobacter piezotolerans]
MRKINLILLFFILATIGFSNQILLQNLRFNGNPPQMVIDVEGNVKPKYNISYDEQNRYLFVEFLNTRASSNLKNKILNGSYVKNVQVRKYKNSTGVFIFFKNNINYSARYWSNPTRFVLNFDKNKAKKEYTIIVDAGHGGKDPGATGFNRYHEKDLALKITKYLKTNLSKDFNVIMTRSNDSFISLSGRPNIGNKYKGDFFVSVHLNSNSSSQANGADIFYFSRTESNYAKKVAAFENSVGDKFGENADDITLIMGQLFYKKNKEVSAKVAQNLVNSYSKKLRMTNRGAHGANFAVLRGFDGPGILVEAGFITNTSDISKIKQAKYQKLAADEIAKAIKQHFY